MFLLSHMCLQDEEYDEDEEDDECLPDEDYDKREDFI